MPSKPLNATLRSIGRLFREGCATGLDDNDLLDRFLLRRDEAAFDALVGRHGPMVWSVARRILNDRDGAEDLFQAVFLVLVTKAHTIRAGVALGAWLHRVTCRLAIQANQDASMRKHLEGPLSDRDPIDTRQPVIDSDAAPLIHAEIDRLPNRYRDPIVLCCLERSTYLDAARRLECSEGTLRNRLSKAKRILRARLVRRGLTLAVAGSVVELVEASTVAAPSAIVASTVRSAFLLACGQNVIKGVVSASVARLVGLGLKSVALARVKQVALIALLAGLFTGVGVGVAAVGLQAKRPGGEPAAAARQEAPKASAKQRSEQPLATESVKYHGRVLDPAGKPFSGAKVYLEEATLLSRDGRPRFASLDVRAATDADGRFQFEANRPRYADVWFSGPLPIFALAPRFGPGWVSDSENKSEREYTITLARDDVPIEGRLLDLEGKPLSGVSVWAERIREVADGKIDSWLAVARKSRLSGRELLGPDQIRELPFPAAFEGSPGAKTDSKGRFTLRGVGRDRIVSLRAEGPTIRATVLNALTRPGDPLKLPWISGNKDLPFATIYSCRFEHLCPPSRPIVGVVKDKVSDKPLAKVFVRSQKFADEKSQSNWTWPIRAQTDSEGAFRIDGMPRGAGNIILVKPMPDQPYFARLTPIPDAPGLAPVKVEISVKRGIVVEGRVLEKHSGLPARGWVMYHPALTNPAAAELDEQATMNFYDMVDLEPDGSFKVLALPGEGAISFESFGQGYLIVDDRTEYQGKRMPYSRLHTFNNDNAYLSIILKEGAAPLRIELTAEEARSVKGIVRDPEGKSLSGALISASYPSLKQWRSLTTAEFEIKDLGKIEKTPGDQPSEAMKKKAAAGAPTRVSQRTALFLHKERKLAGEVTIKADDQGRVSVALVPWGVAVGKLVDQDGQPLAGKFIRAWITKGEPGSPTGMQEIHPYLAETDPEGKFRYEGLIPGLKLEIGLETLYVQNNPFTTVVAKPAETVDVGVIKVEVKK